MRALPILFALIFGLAGCDGTLPPLPGTGLRQIKLFDKSLTVAAPRGYCIDPATSVERGETVVLLIGPCARGGQVVAAVLSLTIGAPGTAAVMAAGPDALASFFASPAGRALLARDGVAEHLRLRRTMVGEGVLYLLVEDREAGEYWRVFSAVRGRLVTISASGTQEAPLTAEQGLQLVLEQQAALVTRNPPPAP